MEELAYRHWEIARDNRKPIGLELKFLNTAAAILVSQYGFEKPPSAAQS